MQRTTLKQNLRAKCSYSHVILLNVFRIWDVPKSLLCKVAGSSFMFFTAYLRHLVEAANTMMPFTKAPPGGLTWGYV